jgi:diguanylate cyclase (GGDEF)-like protein
VLVSVVPVALLALLAGRQVNSTLQERAYDQLGDASRTIGSLLLDRLQGAAAQLVASAEGRPDSEAIRRGLTSVQWVGERELAALVGTEPILDGAASVIAEEQRLFVTPGPKPEFLLTRRFGDRWLLGRLDPERLWQVANLLPYGFDLCVITADRQQMLFCSEPLSADGLGAVLNSMARESIGQLSWGEGADERYASHWELFLPAEFKSSPWRILVSEPASLARQSFSTFNRAILATMAVSLLFTALLAAWQIRLTLKPLQLLVAGTKRIARRDFGTRLDIDSNDEFDELGRAMDEMADDLEQQFGALTAFAEIDSLILRSGSLDRVLEAILDRARDVLPACHVSVLTIDPDQPEHGQLYLQRHSMVDGPRQLRVGVPAGIAERLTDVDDGIVTTAAALRTELAQLPELPGFEKTLVMAIGQGKDVRGAFIAQLGSTARLDDEERKTLRDFAGRLAVAVSSADREQELFERAHFDSLTGLPNRELCHDRLGQAIAQARREGHALGVLFIDLDGFKHVNDSQGHSVGDELLRETATRLTSAVREADTVARLGGDEYLVILPHIYGVLEVEAIVAKLLTSIKRPYLIQGREAFVSASVGAAIFPEDGGTSEELLRRADTAMYNAKESGRSRCVFFTEEMDHRVRERLSLKADLRRALENNEFSLAYQPQLDLQTGRPVCVEVLLRWEHPERGFTPPGVFIPVLEDSDLIEIVGRQVIARALGEFAHWREQGVLLPRISVNLASRQLYDRDLPEFVLNELKRNRLEGEHLELELTEHSLVTDFVHSNNVFRELRGMGVRVAIDDFGTGYSSLSYLQELNFDLLKIDRTFVDNLGVRRSQAIVQAVLTVAHALGKEVVAEGIESEVQQAELTQMGCDIGQGFLFAKPMSADAFINWLRRYDESTVKRRLLVSVG